MTTLDRRRFLGRAAAVAGGAALAGPFAGYLAQPAAGARARQFALAPVPDQRDGVVRLNLPAGFEYRSFHDTASPVTLDDGTTLPARHDGMAAFAARDDDQVWLVRNHELNFPGPAFGPGNPYDPMAQGGTTTTLVDRFGNVE